MEINWYAGHMARAKRIIWEKLKAVDLVIEVADARVPLSSRSPLAVSIRKSKSVILVLNKKDLADPLQTQRWVEWFRSGGTVAVSCDSLSGAGVGEVLEEMYRLLPAEVPEMGSAGSVSRGGGVPPLSFRRLTSMVVGIPNVGKSALINRLAGRKAARTGSLPGLTRGEQWIKVGKRLDLLDTPGVLAPHRDDPEKTRKLAVIGSVREEFFDAGEVAGWVLSWLLENRRAALCEHFGIEAGKLDEVGSILDLIGRKRGFLKKGGEVDRQKTSIHIIKEFRSGRLGRFTLEYPPP